MSNNNQQHQTNQTIQQQKICIGIWGPPNAGKTVYMSMLYHYLTNDIESSPWDVECLDQKTNDFITGNIDRMLYQGQFVRSTQKQGVSPTKHSYNLVSKDGSSPDIQLDFFDLPGGVSVGTTGLYSPTKQESEFAKHLQQCHGIIFLLSPLVEDLPTLENESYIAHLGRLFREMQILQRVGLGKSGKLEQYVAFCVTKVDHEEVREKLLRATPEESILEILGKNTTLGWFKNFFHAQTDDRDKRLKLKSHPSKDNRCQFFYVSPFGVYRDENNVLKSSVYPMGNGDERASADSDSIFSSPKQTGNSSDPYADSDLSDVWYNKSSDKKSKQYLIDTKIKFSPVGAISPIKWLLQGIEVAPPNLSTPNQE